VDKEGRVLAAYADGCVIPAQGGTCTPPNYSGRTAKAAIVRQATGRRLFAAFDPPAPLSAVSRKTHGAVGDFDVDLPLSGSPGIECRTGGANGAHTVIISFANPVTVGGASVTSTDGQAMVSSSSVNGSVVTVNLTKVTNAQTIMINLINVSDGTNVGNVSVPMGVLAGDTNADHFVDSADISQTKSLSGAAVTGSNYREDLNVDGFHDSADIALVKSKTGTALP
jgi:hypothetical protein